MGNQGEFFSVAPKTAPNPMLDAAKKHIEELEQQNLIKPEHRLTCQMVMSLSEAIGKAAAKGQASAMSFASKELREYMALLPKPETIGSFQQLIEYMESEDSEKRAADPLYK